MLLNLRAYHRPDTPAAAVSLLREGRAAVLAGGTELLGRDDDTLDALIDLASLQLDYIRSAGGYLRIGAMTTLKTLTSDPGVAALAGGILARAARQAAPATVRAAATLGGTLAGQKGGDEIPTALLALGARIVLATPDPVELPLELMLAGKADALAGAIITEIMLPLAIERGGFAFVSRTPADRAIVCAAAVGNRVAVGGVAPTPNLLPPDALDTSGWPAVSDHRGSAGYRRLVAPVLARRALAEARGEEQA